MFSHLTLEGIMVDFTMPDGMKPAQCLEGMFFGASLDFTSVNDPNKSLGFNNCLIGGKLAKQHCEAMFGNRAENAYMSVQYPPRLPSTHLGSGCYESMYEGA